MRESDFDATGDYHCHGGIGNDDNPLSALRNFSCGKETPAYVRYLGRVIPAAALGLLVIYCLKDVDFWAAVTGLPVLISMAAVTALHFWKRQMLLSIAGGTVVYMLLVQFVF